MPMKKREDEHTFYMGLALQEARKGLGRTSPNPVVGAVLVNQGEVVGCGYHQKAGGPHAEVHAIMDAGPRARGATLYVTLEPCNHAGRTPPCTEAILCSGIRAVVIGMLDPNPGVTGGGAAYLESQGLRVFSGISEQACRALNYPFIKHSTTGLPWIIMKAGLSLDGKITFRPGQGSPITGPESQQFVHELRNQVDAILIGVETAIIDNPRLTTRLQGSETPSRDPLRVVLDSTLRLPADQQMITQNSAAETWIFCSENAPEDKARGFEARGVRICRTPAVSDGRLDLTAVLTSLGKNNIVSVLVEGGSRIHGAFYRQQLVDELILLYAPYIVGDIGVPLVDGYSIGSREEARILTEISVDRLGNDIAVRALVRDPATL